MRTVSLVGIASRMPSSSPRAPRSSSRWNRIEVCRMRSTRSKTSAPSWSRTVSPRMRPSSLISLRSRVSSSSACASSTRFGRSSASEGTIWDDMVQLSRGCPAIMQSAIFLSQRKIKNEADTAASRTRCSVLDAAPLSRGPTWTLDQQRTAHAARAASGERQMACVRLNPPAGPLPIGVAQAALEDLSRILARQLELDFDVFGYLVVGKRRLQAGTDVGYIERSARLRLRHGHQRLAEFLVRNAENGAVVHTGKAMQHRLDLGRIDVDAARDHHVALAVAEEDIAVGVDIADIARGDEPVAFDLGALLRLVVIGEVRIARYP